MTLDIQKAQEDTNISHNTVSMQEKPAEGNRIAAYEDKTGNSTIDKCVEEAENDHNITNTDILSSSPTEEKLDNGNVLKESIDSVTNMNLQPGEIGSDNETEDLTNTFSRKKCRKLALFHSDSENEDQSTNKIKTSEQTSDNENTETEIGHYKKLKRIAVFDSDSEDDSKENSVQDSINNGVVEYKSVDQIAVMEESIKIQKNKLTALCDSESSDDNNEGEVEGHVSDTELEALQANEIVPKSRKGKQKQKSEDKEEKMTAKKALEQRKEILAESQRRVRESRVSLPYHKPKCRSLKEFLQNRPKLAAPLSEGHSPSLSIRMSMKQLEVITQKMKEREKKVEEFYKSESESEEEITNDTADNTEGNEISDVKTDINQTNSLPKSELRDTDLDLMEKMDIADKKENINEDSKNTDTIENVNSDKIIQNEKSEETFEESKIISKEASGTDECETRAPKMIDHEEVTQSSDEKALTGTVGNPENLNLELTEELSKTKEQVENENELENNEKIVLISDVVIKSTKSDEPKNFYDLDVELLELASEIEKDKIDQHDGYEFNLDDIEDESEFVLENGDIQKKKKITANELMNRKLDMLEKIGVIEPRLSIGPNQVIDLEKGITMPDEISRLRERFLRHNMKLEKHSQKKEVSILSVADGQIHKETLALKMSENEEEDTKPLEKPGVRLQKLREELQQQMSLRRSDLWKEKLLKKNKNVCGGSDNEEGDNEEKSECDAKDILDNEEEEDFTDTEEENDCDMSEKKRRKSAYIDEEAEESEIEENEADENEESEAFPPENEEEEQEDYDALNEEDEVADVEDNVETGDVDDGAPKKKVLRRIIKAFDEESDDEDEANQNNRIFEMMNKNTKLDSGASSENVLSSVELPNYKTRGPILSPEKSEDHFATPVTYMTGLKNLNTSGARIPVTNKLFNIETEKSPADSQDNTQINGDLNSLSTQDVMIMCSGEFPSSSKCISSPEISTQQLKGVFTGSMKSTSDFNTQDIADICSGGFTGTTQSMQTQEKEVVLDDKDEHLISQLIDEDELENFKKKFESPGVTSSINITTDSFAGVKEVVGTGGVIDSEDEETGLKLQIRKRKRLAFSDDEDSSSSEKAQEETIDLQDDDDPPCNVEYDSEENEIEHKESNGIFGENEQKKFKVSDFLEEEAELSESEWGSADEDEGNMDDLEFEKGDEEDFDQDKLRTDIEKLQMRQMLDEDNREVKMLQELLLEDGELHGTGRQRQFKWKNIDATGIDNEERKDNDDDVYLEEEEESEEKWRKERHEREMLKLKKQSQVEEDSLIIESQSLSFTHKSLKIRSQTTFSSQVTSIEVDSSPKLKQPFALLNKRGSFLSRGEKILQKIAESSKVSFTNKNTNRIVFQTVDEETRKRKASLANLGDSTPAALKKLRLSGLSPGLNRDKPRVAKSLFEKILRN